MARPRKFLEKSDTNQVVEIRLRISRQDGNVLSDGEGMKIKDGLERILSGSGYQVLEWDLCHPNPPTRLLPIGANENSRLMLILDFIEQFQRAKGWSPSIREIARHMKIDSTSLITYYLDMLERANYIRREKGVARSIAILHPMSSVMGPR